MYSESTQNGLTSKAVIDFSTGDYKMVINGKCISLNSNSLKGSLSTWILQLEAKFSTGYTYYGTSTMSVINGDSTIYNKASSNSQGQDIYYTTDSNRIKYVVKLSNASKNYGTYYVYSDDSFSETQTFTSSDFTLSECTSTFLN